MLCKIANVTSLAVWSLFGKNMIMWIQVLQYLDNQAGGRELLSDWQEGSVYSVDTKDILARE